ncbi:CLUMA_CG001658, isoform A [Clunio marinus]|uniref:CLUMA_CG001658, isoform A n=1 Tax=Clunio marinus TaxID=568069 RepID=A0A1J1HIK4_9DIPT|nr:CLUMA_CG001658, isoform A [Clunio marinus]
MRKYASQHAVKNDLEKKVFYLVFFWFEQKPQSSLAQLNIVTYFKEINNQQLFYKFPHVPAVLNILEDLKDKRLST